MSESAKIILVGKSKSVLLKEIEGIRAWDNGKDYPIGVASCGEKYRRSLD